MYTDAIQPLWGRDTISDRPSTHNPQAHSLAQIGPPTDHKSTCNVKRGNIFKNIDMGVPIFLYSKIQVGVSLARKRKRLFSIHSRAHSPQKHM